MKKLPKIYKNSEAKPINNNKNIYYSNTVEKADRNEKSITEILNEVFNGIGYSFNIPLFITTNNKVYETSLIAKSKNYVITIDNDTILINDIKSLKYK